MDNFPLTPGSGRNVATDQVTYSGDTADVELVRPVLVTGSEGSKTVVDLPGDATNGLDVDVTRLPALPSGTNNIGDVDVLSVAGFGTVSTANSSTATLGSNAVFTGTSEDVSDYHLADVTVFADQASAIGGLLIEQSSNGTNWDLIDTFPNALVAIAASTGFRTTVVLVAKHFRVVYTNGSSAQGAFRLQTIFKKISTWDGRVDVGTDGIFTNRGPITAPPAASMPHCWSDGLSDWIRSRCVDSAMNMIAGSGLPATGPMAQFDDTSPTTITENRFGNLRISTRRELYTQIRDAAGNERGATVNASNQLSVAGPVTNAGTFAVQVDGSALTALQLIDDPVFADEASFTTGTSKMTMAGVKTATSGSAPDDAGGADRAVSPIATRNRVPFVIGGDPGVITVKHTTITTAVTDAAIITVSTGNKIVVTGITATLDNASTVFPTLLVGFGTANTPTTTGVILAHGGVPAGGGVSRGDGSGIIGIGADNEDLRVTTTGNATGNGLQIVVTYFLVVA